MSAIAFPTPDPKILARRAEIRAALAAILPPEALVTDESGRRAFETDALTAYRRLPLAVVLPRTTEEVARVLRFCREQGVNVDAARRRHLARRRRRAAGGRDRRRPLQDEPHPRDQLADRYARVEAGVTNLAISEAVAADGFFYAPDPSSQLACTIGGNIAKNSGGAHCLKYGVTSNNLMGVRLVTFEGEIVDIGGPALDADGLDLLGLDLRRRGPARHRHRGVGAPPAARRRRAPRAVRLRQRRRTRAAASPPSSAPASCRWRWNIWTSSPIEITENFAHAGYPLDVEAMLIIEVEGSDAGDGGAEARQDHRDRQAHGVRIVRESHVGDGERADLEGPQVRVRRDRPHRRLYLHGRHRADRTIARGAAARRRNLRRATACASPMCSTPATATCIR